MKRFFVLILAVSGLLTIGQTDSKAQSFSFSFGSGPGYYNGGYYDPGYYYYNGPYYYYRPYYYHRYYDNNYYRRHHTGGIIGKIAIDRLYIETASGTRAPG